MGFIKAALLGIIQGLTEFLPISSSGHLKLAQILFKTQESAGSAFDIFLHLGTLVAVLIYYRKVIWSLVVSLFRWRNGLDNQVHYHNRLWIAYLLVSTFCTGVFYLLFKDYLDSLFANPNPLLIAVNLSITGILIYISDHIKDCRIPASSMGLMRSIFIGLGQGVAIVPGISRSGTTIAVSLITGVKRKDAAQYSFLLSIPAILGANLSEIETLRSLNGSDFLNYFTGFMCAAISGYAVIALLINFIRQSKLKYFSYYCWMVALTTLIIVII